MVSPSLRHTYISQVINTYKLTHIVMIVHRLDTIDINKIIDACKSENKLSLYIKDASSLSEQVLELIVNHISPKMIEISVIDCTQLISLYLFIHELTYSFTRPIFILDKS